MLALIENEGGYEADKKCLLRMLDFFDAAFGLDAQEVFEPHGLHLANNFCQVCVKNSFRFRGKHNTGYHCGMQHAH